MKKIPQYLADKIALTVLENKYKEIDDEKIVITQLIKEYYLNKIPKEIKDMFNHKDYQHFIKTFSYISINVEGSTTNFHFKEDIPISYKDGTYIQVTQLPEKLKLMVIGHFKKERELRYLKNKLSDTIYKLGTITQLKENLPEAYKAFENMPKPEVEKVSKKIPSEELKKLKEQLV